ncbi:MAG: methyltransferase domain-containing protein [Bacteroidota bacterium]
MSSWISHLPPEVKYQEVIGLGMNEAELAKNPRLNQYYVHNLNENPQLPFEDNYFDGVGICVSVDYLSRPLEVFRELHRVMKVGAPLVITFSNRCFPTKVIGAWLQLNDQQRMYLVAQYFKQSGGWTEPELLDRSAGPGYDPLYGLIGRKAEIE